MKHVAILGSTGSVGTSALDVVSAHSEKLCVVGLAAGENVERFSDQVEKFKPSAIAMATPAALTSVQNRLQGADIDVTSASYGTEGLIAVATHPEADVVLCASSGTAALEAVLMAIDAGKTIALANKEVLVMAGGLVTELARQRQVSILPVDSEHNAIHQCLQGQTDADIKRLILTASGGPFRGQSGSALQDVTPEDALRHPTWTMGAKITIDSATMMNKGLEVIEAHWLFGVQPNNIDVLIHPQSIVHSMVEFRDGSVIAQLGIADMRLPIQYALSYPERWDGNLPRLDLTQCETLQFQHPDHTHFPCLELAYRALKGKAEMSIALNAANEVAVEAFLDGELTFMHIPTIIERTLDARDLMSPMNIRTVGDVREIDRWARDFSNEQVTELESKQ